MSKMVPNYLINIQISKIRKCDLSENKLCYLQSDVCIKRRSLLYLTIPRRTCGKRNWSGQPADFSTLIKHAWVTHHREGRVRVSPTIQTKFKKKTNTKVSWWFVTCSGIVTDVLPHNTGILFYLSSIVCNFRRLAKRINSSRCVYSAHTRGGMAAEGGKIYEWHNTLTLHVWCPSLPYREHSRQRLMVCRKIIHVCRKNHMKHLTLLLQRLQSTYFPARDTTYTHAQDMLPHHR
jgi:hypothetical protein